MNNKINSYPEGMRTLSSVPEAGVLGSSVRTSSAVSRRRSVASPPLASSSRPRKTSFAGLFENPGVSNEVSANFQERTRRISREAASIISTPSASTKIIAATEKENSTPLSSHILQLYLAQISIRPLKQKRKRRHLRSGPRRLRQYDMEKSSDKLDAGTSDGEAGSDDNSGVEELEDMVRRLDHEVNARLLQQKMRPGAQGGGAKRFDAIDINKVYQNMESAAIATYGPNSAILQRLSTAFIDLPQPVVERRRRIREHQVMAPTSF